MTTMGQTELNASRGLVITDDRAARRPDSDARRNALTSIFWMPTRASPILPLGINASDHIHYWQGGGVFEYTLFDPVAKELTTVVLGPDLLAGQRLQVPVTGGVWKCGASCERDDSAFMAVSATARCDAPRAHAPGISWTRKRPGCGGSAESSC